MFSELPMGVPMPPMAAAAATDTVRALARPDLPFTPPFASTMDRPMPMKMADAARSDTNMDSTDVATEKPTMSFVVLLPANLRAALATRYGMGVDMTAPDTVNTNRQ